MNGIWLRIVGPILTAPEGPPPPKLDPISLPRPARLVPGAQAAVDGLISGFNHEIAAWAAGLKKLVWEAGLTAGGIYYGPPIFIIGLALGWWLRGQVAKMVQEHYAKLPPR